MNTKELSEQQKTYVEQQMIMGSEYEVMVKSKGWEFAQTWYQAQLTRFINEIMSQDTTPIENFENSRQQLIGFKRFLTHVEGAIKTLENERKKD